MEEYNGGIKLTACSQCTVSNKKMLRTFITSCRNK